MGTKHSKQNSGTKPGCESTRREVTVRSKRGASYRHASLALCESSPADNIQCGRTLPNGEINDVGCMLVARAVRETTCTMCSLDLGMMSEIYHAHRGSEPNPFERVEQHVCTRCDAIMCMECGKALNDALQSLDVASLNAVGGCTLAVRLKESLLKMKDLLGTMRRHDYCPRCHPILTKAFEGPFKELGARLAETIDFKFEDDDSSSFVLVDVKSIPEEARMALLEAAAQPTPLLPLKAREVHQEAIVANLRGWLRSPDSDPEDVVCDDLLQVAGAWYALAECLPAIRRVEITPALVVGRLQCYENAVRLQPNNVMFLCAMLANMNRKYTLTVKGKPWSCVNVAEKILEERPRNCIAWRNAASMLSTRSYLEFQGNKYSRIDALAKSIELEPSCKKGWYAAACLVCPHNKTLPIEGKQMTRAEIFSVMLNDAKSPDEDLEDLIVRMFGTKVLVFLLSEVSLLCPNHPRVKKFASQFTIAHNHVIGMGAFGQVYRAERRRGDALQTVAAKVVTTSALQSSTSFQDIPELFMLMSPLFQESVAPAHFFLHDSERRRTTIFMEYAAKGSAHSFMKNEVKGRLHEGLIRAFMYQVIVALRVLHFHGVVHQDIKPPNLLVYGSMEVKLADFGVSCLTYCELFESEAGGTELYMPPEAYNDGSVSTAGDVWSLAATMIELASFHHPVPDPAHVRDPGARHPFRPYIPDHLSVELKQLLNSMLHYDPTMRPTVEDLIFSPYFSAVGLPATAEDEFSQYPDAKMQHGIPARVRELEELSTMGIMTRSAEMMTQGTMAVHTMKQRKADLVTQEESADVGLDPQPVPSSTPTRPIQVVDALAVPSADGGPLLSSKREEDLFDIPSVSPVSPQQIS